MASAETREDFQLLVRGVRSFNKPTWAGWTEKELKGTDKELKMRVSYLNGPARVVFTDACSETRSGAKVALCRGLHMRNISCSMKYN